MIQANEARALNEKFIQNNFAQKIATIENGIDNDIKAAAAKGEHDMAYVIPFNIPMNVIDVIMGNYRLNGFDVRFSYHTDLERLIFKW